MGQEQSLGFFDFVAEEGDTQPPPAPRTGKPVTVLVQLIHTGEEVEICDYWGQPVTSDWTAAHLSIPVEVRLRIPAECQRFTCLGEEAADTDTISQMMRCVYLDRMPESVRLSVHLVDRDQFPQRLAPFVPARVPLVDADFERPQALPQKSGWFWTLRPDAQERLGLTIAGHIKAQASPLHPLSMGADARAEHCIPEEAQLFCFSYPSSAWKAIEANADPFELSTWHIGPLEEYWDVLDFLRVGGFLYFDVNGRIAAVNTYFIYEERAGSRPPPALGDFGVEASALCFADPRPWLPEWTAALVAEGRLQPVLVSSLDEKGAKYFAWLHPGELLQLRGEELDRQPVIPFGGFAYLFHADLYTEEEEEVCLDRYFAVVVTMGMRRRCMPRLLDDGAVRPFLEGEREEEENEEGLGDKVDRVELGTPEDTDIGGLQDELDEEVSGSWVGAGPSEEAEWQPHRCLQEEQARQGQQGYDHQLAAAAVGGLGRCGLWCRGKQDKGPAMQRRRRQSGF